jgi:hypothetical protein
VASEVFKYLTAGDLVRLEATSKTLQHWLGDCCDTNPEGTNAWRQLAANSGCDMPPNGSSPENGSSLPGPVPLGPCGTFPAETERIDGWKNYAKNYAYPQLARTHLATHTSWFNHIVQQDRVPPALASLFRNRFPAFASYVAVRMSNARIQRLFPENVAPDDVRTHRDWVRDLWIQRLFPDNLPPGQGQELPAGVADLRSGHPERVTTLVASELMQYTGRPVDAWTLHCIALLCTRLHTLLLDTNLLPPTVALPPLPSLVRLCIEDRPQFSGYRLTDARSLFRRSNLTELSLTAAGNLRELHLCGCNGLKRLNLRGCHNLVKLSFIQCSRLTDLNLSGCISLESLAGSTGAEHVAIPSLPVLRRFGWYHSPNLQTIELRNSPFRHSAASARCTLGQAWNWYAQEERELELDRAGSDLQL